MKTPSTVIGRLSSKDKSIQNLPKPQFHCVFCGEHGPYSHFELELPSSPNHFIFACPKCKEYKGIEACQAVTEGKCQLDT